MKLSPVMIFILLLLFLVISVVFCRWAMHNMDGFVGYNFDVEPLTTVKIANYSDKNNLYKLYDSLYFDNQNGNIVEVDSAARVTGNTVPVITDLHIVPRIGDTAISYSLPTTSSVIPVPANTIANSYKSKAFATLGKNTDGYTVFMMPWHDNTYIHVIDDSVSNPMNIGTYAFTYSASAMQYLYKDVDGTAMNGVTTSRADSSAANNTMVIDKIYNTKRKVYQISEYVKYDISNGNILVGANDNVLKVYSRNGSTSQTLTSSTTKTGDDTNNGDDQTNVASVNFSPRIIYDLLGQNMILYVPNAKKTLVALICYNSDKKLDLRNVRRFNENGVDTGDPDSSAPSSPPASGSGSAPGSGAGAGEIDYSGFDINDYMLKTQVIPPVCPACPSCNYNAGGACNQCGGNGGAGTRTSNGTSLVTGGNAIRGAVDAVGDAAGGAVTAAGNVAGSAVTAAGNVAGGAVNAAGNVVNKTVDAAGNVVNKTVDTAGNVVNKTVGTVGNVATGAIGAATNLATGVLGAATNVATGAMGAVSNVATGALGTVGNVLGAAGNAVGAAGNGAQSGSMNQGSAPGAMQQPAGGQQPPVSGSTSTSDPYSYYGKLPAKNSNDFMPITANFSSFGK
jgi:hypothetical protein